MPPLVASLIAPFAACAARARPARWIPLAMLTLAGAWAQAAPNNNDIITAAREAWRTRSSSALLAARDSTAAAGHPLAAWVDYWELNNRLLTAQQDELDAFYARWPGSYVEDRLRNDWLLELGRRRDWAHFVAEFPRFRMNDDREVTCYAVLTDHLANKPVQDAARAAWFAQREPDNGCLTLARTLIEDKVFSADEVWRKLRASAEMGRPKTAAATASLLGGNLETAVSEVFENPSRYVTKKANTSSRNGAELLTLALMRMAVNDPTATGKLLADKWQKHLPLDLAATAWLAVAKQSAIKLLPEAPALFQRAQTLTAQARDAAAKAASSSKATNSLRTVYWSDDALGWQVRSALRAAAPEDKWAMVRSAIDAMSAAEQKEQVWQYWRARALMASGNEAERQQGRTALESVASAVHFYGKLASEDLGKKMPLPAKPAPLSAHERGQAALNPGLQRALQLISLGLRSEGVREWNFTLRGLTDRELLAAAQYACDREVWDRCIAASERSRNEIDLAQRFPTPHRDELVAQAQAAGIDPAYVYGIIRQESRFVTDAKSAVGASGLMQLMPTTAKWTAKKIGLPYSPDLITHRATNLKLGTGYLKLLLDDFGGSQALAAAGYNAGPGRPRAWRNGPTIEAAVWAENIPFPETRDYVKRVLSNAAIYANLLRGEPLSIKARLGAVIGPRPESAEPANAELP